MSGASENLSPDFRALFEAAPALYLVLTPELEIVAVSEAYLRATMTQRESILGRKLFEVFTDDPNDPAADGVRNLRESLDRVRASIQPDAMAVQKYSIRRPEHQGGGFEERYWSPVNSPVCAPGGTMTYIIHRVEDVTEFVRLRRAGREQEALTNELKTRAERMESEIFIRAQEVAEANRRLRMANEELAQLYHQISLLMERADRELGSHTELAGTLQSIEPERMLALIGELIGDHKRLEEQLRQSQKMEAVGQLAGGVAHDFNNLLTVITGYTGLLAKQLTDESALRKVDQVAKAAERAAALTAKLLAFSRKQVLQPRVYDLNAIVSGTEELLRRIIGENISLLSVLGPGSTQVKVDRSQLELVIMNLALNARDAMPGGGRLVIETGEVTLADGEVPPLNPGSYVVLSVRDTGHGMDAQTVARIFEPFFTTKAAGKGTGLGLSTALGIAQQSGGTLSVESKLGEGSTFRFYLPAVTEVAEADQPVPLPVASGHGTILLVEDEAPLRELVRMIVTQAGYRVIDAPSGQEALLLSSKETGSIDLLLTDIVMPGMSGPELLQELRTSRPELPVLFMSGYDRNLMLHVPPGDSAWFLPKPFTPDALLAKITELLRPEKSRQEAV